MEVTGLRILVNEPAASVTWLDDWYGEVGAFAWDSQFGQDGQFDNLFGNNGAIVATALTPSAFATTDYLVFDVDAPDAASTYAEVQLNAAGESEADTLSAADFDNYFMIESATAPNSPTVSATIEMDYLGLIDAEANESGYYVAFVEALLELYEDSMLIGMDRFFQDGFGTDSSENTPVGGTLTLTAELAYDTPYWVLANAASQVHGATVPLVGTLSLMLFGMVLALLRRKR